MNVQMSYLIGALVIFTMLAVVFNQKENYDLESRLYHEAVGAASELGSSLLNQLSKLPFDEKTISGGVEFQTELTAPNLLGPETGETNISLFDDIDDYNYFTGQKEHLYIHDTLKTLGVFSTKVQVHYIKKEAAHIVSNEQQWHKMIFIEISNIYLAAPIKLFLITSY